MIRQNKAMQSVNIQNYRRQGGWTFWGLLFVFGTLGFFSYVIMQLVPVYAANRNVANAMYVSVEGKDLRKATRAQIIKSMNGQLYLDGSHKLLDYKKDLKITRTRSRFQLEATYARKVPLFANISVLVDFSPQVDCDLSGRCQK